MNAWERRAAAERAVSQLVRFAQEASIDAVSVDDAGLLRLEAAIAERKMQPRSPSRGSWGFKAATILAAAAMAVVVFMATQRRSNQAFEVANGTVSGSGYIRPNSAEGAQVRFADGTQVVLEASARTRVAEVYPQGARILLEEGKARLNVTPRPDARWLVEAGPYTLQVTGTVFDVAWLGQEESLDLWLREGSVLVTGPLSTQGFVVHAGQRLVARVRENMLLLDGRPSEDFRSHARRRERLSSAFGGRPRSRSGARPAPCA